MQLMRMMAAQAPHSTTLAQLYFKAGPKRALEEMEGFLSMAKRRGQLALDDPKVAAAQFFVLLKGIHHFRCLLGIEPPPGAAARDAHVDQCVALFLRAHAQPTARP